MKYLISLLLFVNFAIASYDVTYSGIKLGVAQNFDTLKENYLEASITNSIAKLLLGKDKFVFYNEDYKGIFNKDTKYKKDKRAIIYLLKKAINNDIKEKERVTFRKDKYLDVEKQKNSDKYFFTYHSGKKLKSKGYFIIKNGVLQILKEEENDIEISRNK